METNERRDLWTRRRFLAIASATAVGSLLAACGSSSTPAPTTAATTAATKPAAAASPAASAAASPAGASAAATPAASGASPAAGATSPAAASITVTAAPATGAAGGQVNVYWTKPVTIHPLFSTSGVEQGVERQMFGALVRMKDKLEPSPTSPRRSMSRPDAKVYTFTLKKGLTFSDGHAADLGRCRLYDTSEPWISGPAATGAAGSWRWMGQRISATRRRTRSRA